MTNFPIFIHKDSGMDNYAVICPDVDGVFAFGDTIDEAISDMQDALTSHIQVMFDENMPFSFATTPIDILKNDPDLTDGIWGFVGIDETVFDRQVRFNVSWSESLLKRVDAHIAKTHDTRSGFLAKLASRDLSATI